MGVVGTIGVGEGTWDGGGGGVALEWVSVG